MSVHKAYHTIFDIMPFIVHSRPKSIYYEQYWNRVYEKGGIRGVFRHIPETISHLNAVQHGSIQSFQYTPLTSILHDVFISNQRTRHLLFVLQRWVHRRWGPSISPSKNEEDLCATPFLEVPSLELQSNGHLFRYSHSDINNLVTSSLESREDIAIAPVLPKHPYTNESFSYVQLVESYAFLQDSGASISNTFRLFRMCQFDLDLFRVTFRDYLRNRVCHHHVAEWSKSTCRTGVLDACHYLKCRSPDTNLKPATYRHFLGEYVYYSQYLLIPSRKRAVVSMGQAATYYRRRLREQLIEFVGEDEPPSVVPKRKLEIRTPTLSVGEDELVTPYYQFHTGLILTEDGYSPLPREIPLEQLCIQHSYLNGI